MSSIFALLFYLAPLVLLFRILIVHLVAIILHIIGTYFSSFQEIGLSLHRRFVFVGIHLIL